MPSYDVVIVGGGGAGLRAAIAVAQKHPDVSVALVSKLYPMRSHTVSAEGGAAAVIKKGDSLDYHATDTISGGDWLCDQDAVWEFVSEATREMTLLEHWGCPWSREPSGHVAVRPFGGMKIERTWFATDKTGFHMLHALFQESLRHARVLRHDEYFATKLIVEDGRCQGVVALDMQTGRIEAIGARAVIVCTGGAGKLFPFTTNASVKTGDGMALAYDVGVGLKDMEFVQYHPTGLPGTGILITEAARGEGGHLYNKEGYRYLQDYNLGKPSQDGRPVFKTMELGPRDRLSQAFYWENHKGRTFEGEYGDYVHLDIRHLGERKIDRKLPFVRELCRKYAGIDPVYEPIPVRPVVHYMMGGIDTDKGAATPVRGLYAAGECACVSINGANRLGSNSLTELLVFGRRAGENAAAFATGCKAPPDALLAQHEEGERRRIDERFRTRRKGRETIAGLRTELQRAMEAGAGIYRSADTLEQARKDVRALKGRFDDISIGDGSRTFNTEVTQALELQNLLMCAEALVFSAAARRESRGSHQRLDFTVRDDQQFLKHSVAYRTEADPRIEYKDVVITRWPPAERVYGAAGEKASNA